MPDLCISRQWRQSRAQGGTTAEHIEAIRRCIRCAFGAKGTNLKDDRLRVAIFGDVVEPLEDFLELLNADV